MLHHFLIQQKKMFAVCFFILEYFQKQNFYLVGFDNKREQILQVHYIEQFCTSIQYIFKYKNSWQASYIF